MGVQNNGGKKDFNNKKPFFYYYFLVLLIVMVLNALVIPMMTNHSVEVPFNEFTKQLDAGNVEDVYVVNAFEEIQYTTKDQQWPVVYKTGNMLTQDSLAQRLFPGKKTALPPG